MTEVKMNSNNGQDRSFAAASSAEKEIKRYLKILRKRKWLILATFSIVYPIWFLYVITTSSGPTYQASALLTFPDPRSMSAVADRGIDNIGKASLIKSNSLLGKVVEILKLNLGIVTEGLTRDQVFKYVDVSSNSIPGEYKLIKSSGKYELYYSGGGRKSQEKKLVSFEPRDTVSVNQITFQVNDSLLKNDKNNSIKFRIRRFEDAIESLRNQLNFNLDKRGTLLKVTGTAKSPNSAAVIVNTVIDRYMELSLKMKRYKSEQVLTILEKELTYAKAEFEEANEKLKQFREKYPWVALTPVTTTQIDQITQYESDINVINQKITDLGELIAKLEKAANMDEKIIVTKEMLTYLSSENIPLLPAFEQQYNDLNLKRNSLLNNYAASHPFIVQNENEFTELINKIKDFSYEHITKLENRLEQKRNNVNSEKYKLRHLPVREIELAELVRLRNVKNDLYGRILTRYNEAKIEHEVEVGDVLIIDRAMPPALQSKYVDILKKLFMGIILALGAGIGLSIVIEFFNKTVENDRDLQEKLKIPVLGSIPIINKENENSGDSFQEVIRGKRDPNLITLDYSPTIESETYRDLRTKILFLNRNNKSSSFLMTSLRPGEGKSLTSSNIAVTLAQQKITTVLVDADVRRGVLHNVFGNKKKPGLTDFLISKATIDYDNVTKLLQSTFVPNLFLISSGSPVPNPTELLGSDRMRELLNLLKSKFGMVILDTPPLLGGSDAIVLSDLIDASIMIVRANFTNVEQLEQKIGQYPFFRDKIMGVILNMVKMDMKKEQYQYSYYQY